jgi:hypothetical protein
MRHYSRPNPQRQMLQRPQTRHVPRVGLCGRTDGKKRHERGVREWGLVAPRGRGGPVLGTGRGLPPHTGADGPTGPGKTERSGGGAWGWGRRGGAPPGEDEPNGAESCPVRGRRSGAVARIYAPRRSEPKTNRPKRPASGFPPGKRIKRSGVGTNQTAS